MANLKQVETFALAKPFAVAMALLGLIAGLIYSVGGFFYDIFTIGLNFGTALAFFAIPVMPIMFATFGFVVGLIGAFLNNLVVGWLKRH